MRKHSVRKWIHAICDLLPLLVIPIFALAVRSDNNFQPIEITTGEKITRTYNFNQRILNGAPTSDLSNITFDADYYDYNEDYDAYVGLNSGSTDAYINFSVGGNVISNHQYLFKISYSFWCENNTYDGVGAAVMFFDNDGNDYLAEGLPYYRTNRRNEIFTFSIGEDTNTTWDTLEIYFYSYNGYEATFDFGKVQLFDLTEMYGLGYEPSLTNFNNRWTEPYYDYTLDTIITDVISDTSLTYNDTDVGSQMVYTLYNTCDKYFNFNNVAVFQDLYDWFGTNLFNGSTPPMSFFIVWNVILYEFIMDLIFLTYMVFMFVIDFTECMIDRFFEKSYRGGR